MLTMLVTYNPHEGIAGTAAGLVGLSSLIRESFDSGGPLLLLTKLAQETSLESFTSVFQFYLAIGWWYHNLFAWINCFIPT